MDKPGILGLGRPLNNMKLEISCSEIELSNFLQHLICLLHENELGFNHLFEYRDPGGTSSQDKLNGRIGSQITAKNGLKLQKMAIVKQSKNSVSYCPAIYKPKMS